MTRKTINAERREQDRHIASILRLEGERLRRFIRRRVVDRAEVEDILQDVFSELVLAYRLAKPIEHAGAWLFRVARNRIIDGIRKQRPESLEGDLDTDGLSLRDRLTDPHAGPDAAFARKAFLDALEKALEELPSEQREVFIAHELEGKSFSELAASTRTSINTLLARKRYAVRHLRMRLADIHQDLSSWSESS